MSSTGPPPRGDGRLVALARQVVDAAWFRHGVALLHEYPVGVGSRVVGRLWP